MRYVPEHEADALYREMLDEAHGPVKVAGMEFDPSRVLAQMDPTAYRCGFIAWCDDEGITTDPDEADADEDEDETADDEGEA